MKITSSILLLLLVYPLLRCEAEDEAPKYYECIERDAFNAVFLYPDGKARYFSVHQNKGKASSLYFDDSATWIVYKQPTNADKIMNYAPFIMVQTYNKDGSKEFRFDYYQFDDKLVEYDKMGIQRELKRCSNMAEQAKK